MQKSENTNSSQKLSVWFKQVQLYFGIEADMRDEEMCRKGEKDEISS